MLITYYVLLLIMLVNGTVGVQKVSGEAELPKVTGQTEDPALLPMLPVAQKHLPPFPMLCAFQTLESHLPELSTSKIVTVKVSFCLQRQIL